MAKNNSKKDLAQKIPETPDEIKKKFTELKAKLEKLKKEILKKFDKYITGVALLPPPRVKPGEPELTDEEKKQIHVLILVDDSDSKKMAKYELKQKLVAIINKTAEDIDKNLKPFVMLHTELEESCYDAKYDLIQDIALSAIFHDPNDMLAALKVAEVHKTMVIKKFEKYITSYVCAGSLFRGEKSNDIDVYVIVDDTDVKKMSRAELKDKLRAIIVSMSYEAAKITGVKKQFHVQTYILTDFWDSLKEASPVIYTLLRDGVPIYDRGVFMPWKLLLKAGRVKPSQEAIDLNMDIGKRLITRTKQKLLSVIGEDLYYAALNPAQAAVMLYGLPPPTPKETIRVLKEIFVKKEHLLTEKDVEVLTKVQKMYKDFEHGKIKEVKGAEIDKLLAEVENYLSKLEKVFEKLMKKSQGKQIVELYDACMTITKDILRQEKIKAAPLQGFKTLTEKGRFPERFLTILKAVNKAKKDYDKKKLTRQEIEKTRREASMFIKAMTEYMQRKRIYELERAKIRFKYGNKMGEALILENEAYIIPDLSAKQKEYQKANIVKGRLQNIKTIKITEFEKAIAAAKIPQNVFMQESIFADLRTLFGTDIKILINY